MEKMWAGRAAKATDKLADDFNSSIRFDSRMYRQDITGSIVHAQMLASVGILTVQECAAIVEGLSGICADIDSGVLPIDPNAEDIHMFVESQLTARIGDTGKKLHTARSRNDQVALDLRMYLRDECEVISRQLLDLIEVIADQAAAHKGDILPGYTHLQRAQPIVFAHHLLAYAMMFKRDYERIGDAVRRMNVSPIGCCALAGTTYQTDRTFEAERLGFSRILLPARNVGAGKLDPSRFTIKIEPVKSLYDALAAALKG